MLSWQEKSRMLDHKPNPVQVIPEELHGLGEVFFPIPPLQKGWNYPHGSDEHRFAHDSEDLNAYLEQGWGYGIACAGDLVVVDVDEMEYVDAITEILPETLHQVTGSREGVHLFYMVEGLDSRQILKDEGKHLGEIKCDPHGYVVGPGSLHPSGNEYGPIQGEEIAKVGIADLLYAVSPCLRRERTNVKAESGYYKDSIKRSKSSGEMHELYSLTAGDVMPSLPEGKRCANPVHGSSTGSNFMKNEGGDTFTCWRCQNGSGDGCVIAPVQLLAAEAIEGEQSDHHCEYVKERWARSDRLHFLAWKLAVGKGLISPENPPSRVIRGWGVENGEVKEGEDMPYEKYNTLRNAVLWEFGIGQTSENNRD